MMIEEAKNRRPEEPKKRTPLGMNSFQKWVSPGCTAKLILPNWKEPQDDFDMDQLHRPVRDSQLVRMGLIYRFDRLLLVRALDRSRISRCVYTMSTMSTMSTGKQISRVRSNNRVVVEGMRGSP